MKKLYIIILALLGLFFGGYSLLYLLVIMPRWGVGIEIVSIIVISFIFAAACVWGIVRLLR